jgi:ketosteroid isomerase-like protein
MLRSLLLFALLLIQAPHAFAQKTTPPPSPSTAEAEVREAIRKYDDALGRADAAAVERFWAEEYTFINPRGERLTRADRIANLRSGQTALDVLVHVPREEHIRVYGDVAVYTTLLSIKGRYSGQAHKGAYRGLVVWVRRDGRWQQVVSQLSPVLGG